jgi:ankyrin repeat protein
MVQILDHQTKQTRYTALHFAAEKGQLDTVKVLLRHGADPSTLNAQGKTAAQLANNRAIKNIFSPYS